MSQTASELERSGSPVNDVAPLLGRNNTNKARALPTTKDPPGRSPHCSSTNMSTEAKKPDLTFREILDKSAKSAIRGGTAGAVAMGANVAALMWMRTTVGGSGSCSRSSRRVNSLEMSPGQLPIPQRSQLSHGPAHPLRRRRYPSFLPWRPPGPLSGSPQSIRRHSGQHWSLDFAQFHGVDGGFARRSQDGRGEWVSCSLSHCHHADRYGQDDHAGDRKVQCSGG